MKSGGAARSDWAGTRLRGEVGLREWKRYFPRRRDGDHLCDGNALWRRRLCLRVASSMRRCGCGMSVYRVMNSRDGAEVLPGPGISVAYHMDLSVPRVVLKKEVA